MILSYQESLIPKISIAPGDNMFRNIAFALDNCEEATIYRWDLSF